jgi:TPR repeat protein
MPGMNLWRLAALAFAASALTIMSAQAQVSAGSTLATGLHVTSPPAVLNDPVVKRCRLLAARRTDPSIPPPMTAVEKAAMTFQIEPVLDAVATCRVALAAYPNEPSVIIAHYNASEALSGLALGPKLLDSEAAALKALEGLLSVPAGPGGNGGATIRQMMAFYVASDYEYGIDTQPDRAAAMKWYAVAADAGDAISKRELARLQAAKPGEAQVALHIDSPPTVLNDPAVKRCRMLAARRMDPSIEPMLTAAEQAAFSLEVEPLLEAVATCRAALAAHPNEPKVIVAHYTASEALSNLALGLNFPESEADALALARREVEQEQGGGIVKQLLAFYIASAYEYGVGTRPDRSAAMKWYAAGADAGDAIAKRELARLQAAK